MRETRMTDFLLRLLIGCLIIVGVWGAFAKGELLGWFGDRLERRFPEVVLKPIFLCPPCMASLWGSTVWFIFGGDLIFWVPFVLALSGLNRIVAGNLLK